MNLSDIQRKNIVLITYIKSIITDYEVVAEYNTDDNIEKVIVIQEQTGKKVVFGCNDTTPLFNYYMIDIYGILMREAKETSVILGNLIGNSVLLDVVNDGYNEKWQIIFMQYGNPQAINYEDIRRIGYNSTMKCIVNMVAKTPINE